MKKNILLGISGGIAAYKMVEVASRLVKKGYEVDVIMTESATNFVGPVTFESLTGNPVAINTFSPGQSADIQHISLAKKADIVLVSPATANIIAKMAHGLADDLLSTTLVATTAPVLVAPAMNVNMYNNPVVQDNLSQLEAGGFRIITPGSGYLACGDQGSGRMPEPFILVEHIIKELTENSLQGNRVLITAGPTREPLDPVRYLSNFASGKMGYALARSAAYHGGEVTLVSGPTNLDPPPGVQRVEVTTAGEMKHEVKKLAGDSDIIIMTAAVADYRPAVTAPDKLKKEAEDTLQLELVRNPDILAGLGHSKKPGQLLVGFAAETRNLLENAREKLDRKNLDMIIANDIGQPGIGFGSDRNQVTVITPESREQLPIMDKQKLARVLIERIKDLKAGS